MSACPFCDRYGRGDFTTEPEWPFGVIAFEPLNPVTPGHMLFVSYPHTEHPDAPAVARCMSAAAQHAEQCGEDFNLITSGGAAATQTVPHVHIHYVPRRGEDGLPLPWTGQQRESCKEPDTMTWPRDWSYRQLDSVVAWIKARGGDAHYKPHPARIVITGPDHDIVMHPGDTAVMGEPFCVYDVQHPRWIREFSVRPGSREGGAE